VVYCIQVICAQLGIPCGWMGTSTDPATDTDAKFIFDELKRYHINTSACYLYQKGSMPISVRFFLLEIFGQML
jgi:hypothetical protein